MALLPDGMSMAKRKRQHSTQSRSGRLYRNWSIAVLVLCVYVAVIAGLLNKPSMPQPSHAATTSALASNSGSSVATPPITVIKAANPSSANTFSITFNITDDLASGTYGYWALGNYTRTVSASLDGNNTYYAIVTSRGTWRSIKGARSPITGVPEPINATGNFIGVYNAMIPGRLNTTLKLNGYVGTFNDSGTFADLLKNQSSQPGDSALNTFNWEALYLNTTPEYMNLISSYTIFDYGNQTYVLDCVPSGCSSSASANSYFYGNVVK